MTRSWYLDWIFGAIYQQSTDWSLQTGWNHTLDDDELARSICWSYGMTPQAMKKHILILKWKQLLSAVLLYTMLH